MDGGPQVLDSASRNCSSPLALKNQGDSFGLRFEIRKPSPTGCAMVAQGVLDFQYEADSSPHGLTSLAGLAVYFDLLKASGLGEAIRRHVRAAGGQGWLDIQMALAVVFL